MKNIKCLVLLLLVAVSLSACGPSAEEKAELQAETAQYNAWAAQAEEVEPLLCEAITFSGVAAWEAEISAYNTGGDITASVKVTSDNATRSGFGAIVSLVGNRFIELSEEYVDYSFSDITFFYYQTANLGRELGDAEMTYKLNVDGSSTFLEPGADVPAQYDIAPDDVCDYLAAE